MDSRNRNPQKTLTKNIRDPYAIHDFSHISQNQSQVIHDENYELYSENSSTDEEFFDKDIPMEKRDLINNPSYFKQLSLSFYGNKEPLQPQRLELIDDNRLHLRTEMSRPEVRSQSPRSGMESFHNWRKSPVLPSEKETFQSSYNNLFQALSKPNPLYAASPKAHVVHYKTKGSDKPSLREAKNITGISQKDLNTMRASPTALNMSNMSFTRTAAAGMYPQLNNVSGYSGYGNSLTPKNGNLHYSSRETPANISTKKIIIRPPLKKLGSAKSKLVKDFISATEPSTSYLKSPPSVQPIPKRLQMYAQDNMTNLNLKVLMSSPTAKLNKGIPSRPSLMMNTTRSSTNTTKRAMIAVGSKTKRNYE